MVMVKTKVLVAPPTVSPTTGRKLGWTASHAPDCAWALGVTPVVPYQLMDADEVPSHVERCSHCGGGR